MSAKSVASLSSGLLKRGTREQSSGFVLSPAAAAARQADDGAGAPEALGKLTVRMRSTGGESWSPGAGVLAEDSCDGSLEALSRRIGPLVSEYLGSAAADPGQAADAPPPDGSLTDGVPTDGAPTDGAPTDGAPADGAPTDRPVAKPGVARDSTAATQAAETDPAGSGETSWALPAMEGREATVLEMIQAFRNGDRMMGEELFGALTGLAPEEVSRLLYHESGDVLASSCRALGMDQLHFVSLFVMTRKGTLSRHAVDLRDLGRIIDHFNGLGREAAARILANWRRTAWD